MGYTHYWTPVKATEKKFNKVAKEAQKLLENLPANTNTAGGYHIGDSLVICDGMGRGEPIINDKEICFNGDEKTGMDHETFLIKADVDNWNFCKTARKPYDLLVCAVLISAHRHLGYEVRSDGKLKDWKPAIEFYFNTIENADSIIAPTKKKLANKYLPEFLVEEMNGKEA